MIEGERQKLKPCVGVMVWKDGKVLMGKRRGRHGSDEYAFPGGHLEYMESFEECSKRETLEESGIEITDLKFLCLANYQKHEDRQDILVGFVAKWKGGDTVDFPEERIGEWDWYSIDNLPSPLFYPSEVMIKSYKTGENYYDKE